MKYIILISILIFIFFSCSTVNRTASNGNPITEQINIKNDTTGLIENGYKNIAPCFYNENERFIISRNNKLGVIDNNNKIIIPLEYDAISNWLEGGPIAHYVVKNNKVGLLYYHNEVLIPAIYDSLYYYSHSVIKVKLNGKIWVINAMNKIIIPLEYDALIVEGISNQSILENDSTKIDKFIVKKEEKWSSLNYQGEILRSDIPQEDIDNEQLPFFIYNHDFLYIDYKILKTENNSP